MTVKEFIEFCEKVEKDQPGIMDADILVDGIPQVKAEFGWSGHNIFVIPTKG